MDPGGIAGFLPGGYSLEALQQIGAFFVANPHLAAPSEAPQTSFHVTSQPHQSLGSRAPFQLLSGTPSTVTTPSLYDPPNSLHRPPPPFADSVRVDPSVSSHDAPELALDIDHQEEGQSLSSASQAVPSHFTGQHNDDDDVPNISALPRLGNPFSGRYSISNQASSRGRGGREMSTAGSSTRGGCKPGLTRQALKASSDHGKADEDYPAKRYSLCKEGFVYYLPSTIPLREEGTIFDQDKWVHERQFDWFRKNGLVKQPYIHGGRKMSSTEVLRPQNTETFNTLKKFWENSAYCYLVPAGWEDPSRHPPARRLREERWWHEYKALTERLRQERNSNTKKGNVKADNRVHDGPIPRAKPEMEEPLQHESDAMGTVRCPKCYGVFLWEDLAEHCKGQCEEDIDSDDDVDLTFAKPVTKRQRNIPSPTSPGEPEEEQEGPGVTRSKKRKGKNGKAFRSLALSHSSAPEEGVEAGDDIDTICEDNTSSLAGNRRGNFARRGRRQDLMNQTRRPKPDKSTQGIKPTPEKPDIDAQPNGMRQDTAGGPRDSTADENSDDSGNWSERTEEVLEPPQPNRPEPVPRGAKNKIANKKLLPLWDEETRSVVKNKVCALIDTIPNADRYFDKASNTLLHNLTERQKSELSAYEKAFDKLTRPSSTSAVPADTIQVPVAESVSETQILPRVQASSLPEEARAKSDLKAKPQSEVQEYEGEALCNPQAISPVLAEYLAENLPVFIDLLHHHAAGESDSGRAQACTQVHQQVPSSMDNPQRQTLPNSASASASVTSTVDSSPLTELGTAQACTEETPVGMRRLTRSTATRAPNPINVATENSEFSLSSRRHQADLLLQNP